MSPRRVLLTVLILGFIPPFAAILPAVLRFQYVPAKTILGFGCLLAFFWTGVCFSLEASRPWAFLFAKIVVVLYFATGLFGLLHFDLNRDKIMMSVLFVWLGVWIVTPFVLWLLLKKLARLHLTGVSN